MTSLYLRSSEGESQAGDEALGGRQDRLETAGSGANGARLRIPHMPVGDVDVDFAVARCVPSLLRRQKHREVASRNTDLATRSADHTQPRRLQRVGGGELAELEEASLVRTRSVGLSHLPVGVENRIVVRHRRVRGALVVQRANLGVRLIMTT